MYRLYSDVVSTGIVEKKTPEPIPSSIALRVFYKDYGDIKNGYESEDMSICGYSSDSTSYPVLDYYLDDITSTSYIVTKKVYDTISQIKVHLNDDGTPNMEYLESNLEEDICIGMEMTNGKVEKRIKHRTVIKAQLLYHYGRTETKTNHFNKEEAKKIIDRYMNRNT